MEHIKKLVLKVNKKIIKLGKKQIIFILVASFIASFVLTAYSSILDGHIDYMIVTLNYEGAKKGLNPDGSRFKISEIKTDTVLKSAINTIGDKSLSVDSVRDRITIDSKMPLSAIEKTSSAIASGSTYSYNPSEFDVYYSQKNKFGKNNTTEFLNALAKAYKEYFLDRYSEKNTILEFDATEDFSGYDYYEMYQVLTDKVNSMVSYLGKHQAESPTYRSAQTGYTFENLTKSLLNLRDYDLKKFESFVVQNRISKDKAGFVRKQDYLADRDTVNYQSNMQTSDIIKEALELYDPRITGVAFIPSVDGHDEYYMSRTKTGLDNLAMKSYNKGLTANVIKKRIDEHLYLAERFDDIAETPEEAKQNAELMIGEISGFLEKISSVALMTDKEYMSDKTKDYITFKLPDNGMSIPVVGFVKNFMVIAILLLAAYRAFLYGAEYIKKKGLVQKIVNELDKE